MASAASSATTDPSSGAGKSTLLIGLIVALLLVAAVPFALVAFQTWQANEALIDQAQRAHLLYAKATSDRVRYRLATLENTLDALAGNPAVFTDPNSSAAQEAIAGALLGRSEVLATASFFAAPDNTSRLIKMARRPDFSWVTEAKLALAGSELASLTVADEDDLILLSRPTARPGLRVAAAILARPLSQDLTPRELGATAKIALITRQNAAQHVAALNLGADMPAEMRLFADSSALACGATRLHLGAQTQVGAFAQISNSPWTILTLQPAEDAESARALMRRSALIAAAVVSALVSLLSLLAWRFLLRPIRQLFQMQRRVLGFSNGAQGSDLAQLRASFEQLEALERDNLLRAKSPQATPQAQALQRVFLDRYQIVSSLGQGAMGSVFRAWDPRLCREVAIKTVRLSGVDDETRHEFTRMLRNEAIAVAKLHHPNVVVVHDCLVKDEFAFVVMQYVEGENLRAYALRLGALDEHRCRAIAVAILRGLSAAHSVGFLHRDVKQANVLLSVHAEIKLGDFGIAARRSDVRDGAENTDIGTEGYIAPECQQGGRASVASDLYALGIVLFEAITGQVIGAHQQSAPHWREHLLGQRALSPDFLKLLFCLTSADPSARPETAELALKMLNTAHLDQAFRALAQSVLVSATTVALGPETKIARLAA
jgi:tRNA A-37 threonylcarbamoyl transferase component Bud32